MLPQTSNPRRFTGAEPLGSAEDCLIIFTRYPEAGQAKTRIIPTLGAERAARLQAELTRHTLNTAVELCASRPCRLEIRYAGGDRCRMSALFGDGLNYVEQHGADLGVRLQQAAAAAFQAGAKRVVIIGTDSPDLDASGLSVALTELRHADVVLGPAVDGGYYLIGLSGPRAELFEGIDWGTEQVLQQTLAKARDTQSRVKLLPPLADVDHPEDLVVCRRHLQTFGEVLPCSQDKQLSIIIPALNEEHALPDTLAGLVGIANVEVIVADGGSTDATYRIASDFGASVVPCRRGRGRQMNAGAALASGKTLLFVHADSRLPLDFQTTIRTLLAPPNIAGAFRLRVDAPSWALRCVEWAANLRSRFFQMPYGDQGLFVSADIFFACGGFPHWPLMEDYEFCRRLSRRGRIALADSTILTSARRWANLGVFQTTLINQCTLLGFHLGVSPDRLASWYTGRMKRRR